MAGKLYKLIVRLDGVEQKHLPLLIHAIQLAGRQLHATATIVAGDGPKPEIVLYGEDIDFTKK